MSEQRKAIIISTGMDNVQLLATLKDSEVATGTSLDRIKGLYTKFSEQQATLEARRNADSLAKLKANDDLKLAEMERFFTAQAAMYAERDAVAAVGQGSVPQGWAHKAEHVAEAVAGGAAFGAGAAALGRKGKEAEEAKHAAGSLREAGHALRELGHIIGELTGLSLAVRVLKSVGTALRAIAMIGAGAVSVIAAGAAAIGGNLWMRKQLEGMGGESKESVETRFKQHRDLTAYIKNLEKNGTLDDKTSKDMLYRIRGGDTESLIGTQRRLMKMGLNGPHAAGMEHGSDLARNGMNPDQRWNDTTMQLMRVQAEMQGMDPKSTLYHQKDAEHKKLLHQQSTDSAGIAKWTASLKKAETERASLTAKQQTQDRVYPTLAELSKVNSAQGDEARQYFSLKKDQLSLRSRGDSVGANFDASQMSIISRTLATQGAIAPDAHLAEIKAHLKTLNGQITSLRAGKQQVVIVGVGSD